MKHWWKDADWGKLKYLEESLSQCHYVHQKFRTDCPEIKPRPLSWETSNWLPKKIIRIMMGCRSRDSCIKLFFNLEILPPAPSQYILSLLLFMIRNKNQFLINSEIYHTNTRQHANLHQPSVNITKYQKAVYCLGVKVFNMLPPYIKTESDNPKKFKVVLQTFFMTILFILWRNILNFKKVKYSHMNWIDIWKIWHICSFYLIINLYHIMVCKILPS